MPAGSVDRSVDLRVVELLTVVGNDDVVSVPLGLVEELWSSQVEEGDDVRGAAGKRSTAKWLTVEPSR
jgi:hypothetical protein